MSAEAIPWRSGRASFLVEILEMRGRGLGLEFRVPLKGSVRVPFL